MCLEIHVCYSAVLTAETEVECVHPLLPDVRLTNCLKVVELYLVWTDGMKLGHKLVVV